MAERKSSDRLSGEEKSEEKFDEMLSSPSFQKALRVSAECTLETGLETGFQVHLLWNSPLLSEAQLWIEEVRVGESRGMRDPKTLEIIDGSPDALPPDFLAPRVFFSFHLHPHDEGAIIPSPEDLNLFRDRLFRPEFVGIGHVDGSRKVRMLVMPRPRYRLDIDFYDQEVDKVQDQNGVMLLLGRIGLDSFRSETEI